MLFYRSHANLSVLFNVDQRITSSCKSVTSVLIVYSILSKILGSKLFMLNKFKVRLRSLDFFPQYINLLISADIVHVLPYL